MHLKIIIPNGKYINRLILPHSAAYGQQFIRNRVRLVRKGIITQAWHDLKNSQAIRNIGGHAVNKVLVRTFITLMLVSCFANTSYGGKEELSMLIQSRDYWSNFNWDNLSNSELYLSTNWDKVDNHDNMMNNSLNIFSTELILDNLDIETTRLLSIEKTDKLLNLTIIFKLKSNHDEYYKVKQWCSDKFEAETYSNEVTNRLETQWKIGNTLVSLTSGCMGTTRKKCSTDLLFKRNDKYR